MNRALVLALCAGLTMAPAAASSSETYRLCGPGAAGFVRAGGAVACIKGAPPPGPPQAAAKPQPAVKAGANRMVDDALNSADLAFNDGHSSAGCLWVRNAISADLNDYGDVPPSKDQREQLKKYAQRCNLRY